MEQVDLILKPQWILPIVPANKIFEDCALVAHQGIIKAILPCAEADRRYQAEKAMELPGQLLMPGLVNAHGHAAMSLLRGSADDLPLDTWLKEHIWPAETHWVSEDFVRDGTRHAIAEMLFSGTTCFSDQYFFPEVAVEVAIQAGIRLRAAFPILEFPSAWAQNVDEYIHKGLALRDDYKNHPLIDIAFGPHAPYTLEDSSLERVAVLAEELDTHIHIHLQETAQEVSDSLKLHGLRPTERMKELGILSPRTEAVHMTQISDEDIELLNLYNTSVIHCPQSNMKLASGICPISKLREAGVLVGLGTDGAASNNNLDMLKEMNSASLLAKVSSGDASELSAFESLKLATLDSAEAMGMSDRIGSLEAGKQADMIAIDMESIGTTPLYNIASQLVYASSSKQVSGSWVAGKQLVADHQLCTLNRNEILVKSREWASKISG